MKKCAENTHNYVVHESLICIGFMGFKNTRCDASLLFTFHRARRNSTAAKTATAHGR